jgi:hypothetical protein
MLTYYHSLFSVDSKTDSKTGGQQWISVDGGGHAIGFWSGWETSVDGGRRGVPKGGLLPTPRWVLPLHRLLALLEQVLLSTKEAW